MTAFSDFLSGIQPETAIIKLTLPNQQVTQMCSTFYLSGIPSAGVFPSVDVTGEGVALSGTVQGQIPMINALSGFTTHLAQMMIHSGSGGQWLLCDRLWHNKIQSNASTSPQTINSVTFPARDDNQSSNGKGVIVGLEIEGGFSLTQNRSITIAYTNSEEVSGRTAIARVLDGVLAYSNGAFIPFEVPDAGVRSIQSVQNSGSIGSAGLNASLVAYRVIASMSATTGTFIPRTIDMLTGGLPKIWNDSVLFLVFIKNSNSTPASLFGSITLSIV